MKKVIVILFVIIISSCESTKNILQIYYFDNEVSSPIRADCNLMFTFYGLKKIEISDKKEIKDITEKIRQLKKSNLDNQIDIRYQVIVNKDTLCFDRFSNVLYNGQRKENAAELLSTVNKMIDKNKNKAMVINKIPISVD